MSNDLNTYVTMRKKSLSLWHKLSEDKKEKLLHSLGLLFGEYRHLMTYTNRKAAYRGNSTLTMNLKVDNLEFWCNIQLDGYYPCLTQRQKQVFIDAANKWYKQQFKVMGLAK